MSVKQKLNSLVSRMEKSAQGDVRVSPAQPYGIPSNLDYNALVKDYYDPRMKRVDSKSYRDLSDELKDSRMRRGIAKGLYNLVPETLESIPGLVAGLGKGAWNLFIPGKSVADGFFDGYEAGSGITKRYIGDPIRKFEKYIGGNSIRNALNDEETRIRQDLRPYDARQENESDLDWAERINKREDELQMVEDGSELATGFVGGGGVWGAGLKGIRAINSAAKAAKIAGKVGKTSNAINKGRVVSVAAKTPTQASKVAKGVQNGLQYGVPTAMYATPAYDMYQNNKWLNASRENLFNTLNSGQEVYDRVRLSEDPWQNRNNLIQWTHPKYQDLMDRYFKWWDEH